MEQVEVNRAVDLGVLFLKKAQLRSGTWVADGNNSVSYAALPALTLLECGVAADDPVIKNAAGFVRRSAQSVEHPTERTYDLALTILFLDKLGDPRDDALIRSMARAPYRRSKPDRRLGIQVPCFVYTTDP